MKSTHQGVLSTLTHVQAFLDDNKAVLGIVNQSGYRTVLDNAVTALNAHGTTQTTTKATGKAQSAKQRVLRNALKTNHMKPIATIATAQLSQVPEFTALKMPKGSSSSRALILAAGAMGAVASQYVSSFTGAGLPSDFLAQLKAASDALDAALQTHGAVQGKRSGATAALTAAATNGRQAVKVLDSIVEPQLAGNAGLLGEWKTVKKFGGKVVALTNTAVDAAAKGVSAGPTAIPVTPSTTAAATPPATAPAAAPAATPAAPSPAPATAPVAASPAAATATAPATAAPTAAPAPAAPPTV